MSAIIIICMYLFSRVACKCKPEILEIKLPKLVQENLTKTKFCVFKLRSSAHDVSIKGWKKTKTRQTLHFSILILCFYSIVLHKYRKFCFAISKPYCLFVFYIQRIISGPCLLYVLFIQTFLFY